MGALVPRKDRSAHGSKRRATMFGGRYTRRPTGTGFLVRPRLGPFRTTTDMATGRPPSRKQRTRKPFGNHKMESLRKKPPDYTDIAYREAVARLRYLLAESYSPLSSPAKGRHVHHSIRGDESGDDAESVALSERSRPHHHHPLPANLYRFPTSYSSRRSLFADSSTRPLRSQYLPSSALAPAPVPPAPASEGEGAQKQSTEAPLPPPELMTFIERQEEYIEQLEKESQFCREELAALLGKVKEVISENEGLHEREKAGLLKSVFDCFEPEEEEDDDQDDQEMDQQEGKMEKAKSQKPKKKRLEGPSIIFESRISELEAQLTKTKMDLRKALEEAEAAKKKLLEQQSGGQTDCTAHSKVIQDLRREKTELNDSMSKLQTAINQFREKDVEAAMKVKRSLDVADQAQFEKAQVEDNESAGMTQPPRDTGGATQDHQSLGTQGDTTQQKEDHAENATGSAQEDKPQDTIGSAQENKPQDTRESVQEDKLPDTAVSAQESKPGSAQEDKGGDATASVLGESVTTEEKARIKKKARSKAKKVGILRYPTGAIIDLTESKMSLLTLEMSNAKLTEEKLKLEMLVHKARLEYYHKKNARIMARKKSTVAALPGK